MSWVNRNHRQCWKCGQTVAHYSHFYYRGFRSSGSRFAPARHLVLKGKHWTVCKGSDVPANCKPAPYRPPSMKMIRVMRTRQEKITSAAIEANEQFQS